MPDIVLGVAQQEVLRSLLAEDGRPADVARQVRLLEQLAQLVPCDAIGIGIADPTGMVVSEICLPHDHLDWPGPHAWDGPLPLGLQHWSRQPHRSGLPGQGGLRDSLSMGFRGGADQVVQVWLDRWGRTFDDRDATMLGLVAPVLDRLFRNAPVAGLPAALTTAEQRVLQLVATGLTNGQVAERLFVTQSTVRKHLEHAYRKLGVPNRVAAVRRLEGLAELDADRSARVAHAAAG